MGNAIAGHRANVVGFMKKGHRAIILFTEKVKIKL